MSTGREFAWLFFGLSGRISRQPYALAVLLSYLARMLPFYQILRHQPETAASEFWSLVFIVALVLSLWANVALTVKRLHDFDKPGTFAVVTIFLDVIAVVIFAVIRGTPGPNGYGQVTNRP